MATTIELRAAAVAKVDAQARRINLNRARAEEQLARECAEGRRCGRWAAACDALLKAYRAADALACEHERIISGGYSPVAVARFVLAAKHAVHAAMVA